MFAVIYDSLNNKNKTDIKVEKSIVNVLCQFLVKYYLLKVFISESNLSKSKTTHVLTYFYINCFYAKNSVMKFVQAF